MLINLAIAMQIFVQFASVCGRAVGVVPNAAVALFVAILLPSSLNYD